MKALALMYHDVVEPGRYESSGFPAPDAQIYKLEREEFGRHLEAIGKVLGGRPVEAIERARTWAAERPLFLTFDDGGASACTIAGMLEERGWPGHFFVTTDRIGQPGFLSDAQIAALRRRGHVIGTHSCSHPRLSRLEWPELLREWKSSIQRLAEITGDAVRTGSVPGGYYSRAVAAAAAAAGLEVLFTSQPTARVRRVDGCLVLGRYGIQRGMSAQRAADFAAGRLGPRWRQALYWQVKAAAKAAGGPAYDRFRQIVLSRR
jgi:peptidoglycan/xylan/chitin deacetylase (PgdA/CDA1 family)